MKRLKLHVSKENQETINKYNQDCKIVENLRPSSLRNNNVFLRKLADYLGNKTFKECTIDDLNEQSTIALEKNNKDFENLQSTKNILQDELSNRRNDVILSITVITLIVMIIAFVIDVYYKVEDNKNSKNKKK